MHGAAWANCPNRTEPVGYSHPRARGYRPASCQCDRNSDSQPATAIAAHRAAARGFPEAARSLRRIELGNPDTETYAASRTPVLRSGRAEDIDSSSLSWGAPPELGNR